MGSATSRARPVRRLVQLRCDPQLGAPLVDAGGLVAGKRVGLCLVLEPKTAVLRTGIEAVHPSQRLAARSLGLSHYRSLRLVVMPQAIRQVTPALMNDFVSMQKDVGLISVLGAVDAVRAAQIQVADSYNYTAYVVAGLMFVALSWPFIRLTDWLAARQQAREQSSGMI